MGYFKDDVKCGRGKMTWHTRNEQYIGEWQAGQPHGEGVHLWLDDVDLSQASVTSTGKATPAQVQRQMCTRYEGHWKAGKRSGYGVFYYSTGAKYEGQWKEGRKHGAGVYMAADGAITEAQFTADKMTTDSKRRKKGVPVAVLRVGDMLADLEPATQHHLQKQLQHVLLRWNSQLRGVYQHYSTLEADQADSTLSLTVPEQQLDDSVTHSKDIDDVDLKPPNFSMTLWQLWAFCRDVQVTGPDLTLTDVDRLLTTVKQMQKLATGTNHTPDALAAVKIQSVYRGRRDRQVTHALKLRREQERLEAELAAKKERAARRRARKAKRSRGTAAATAAAPVDAPSTGRDEAGESKSPEEADTGRAGGEDSMGEFNDSDYLSDSGSESGHHGPYETQEEREQAAAAQRIQAIARGKRDRARVLEIKAERAALAKKEEEAITRAIHNQLTDKPRMMGDRAAGGRSYHDPDTPVLFREFLEVLTRIAALKYDDDDTVQESIAAKLGEIQAQLPPSPSRASDQRGGSDEAFGPARLVSPVNNLHTLGTGGLLNVDPAQAAAAAEAAVRSKDKRRAGGRSSRRASITRANTASSRAPGALDSGAVDVIVPTPVTTSATATAIPPSENGLVDPTTLPAKVDRLMWVRMPVSICGVGVGV